MKNYGDFGACYPPRPNTLLDLHNFSDHTQPYPVIANNYLYSDLISLPQINRGSSYYISMDNQSIVDVNEKSKCLLSCHSLQFHTLQFGCVLYVSPKFVTMRHAIIVYTLY